MKYRYRAFLVDFSNKFRFGTAAPIYAELVWINPPDCWMYLGASDGRRFFSRSIRSLSGRVVSGWPDAQIQPLISHPVLRYCLAHWVDGLTWEDAGAIDYMMKNISASPTGVSDDCRNLEDVIQRFERLDAIWAQVKEKGRLPTRQELLPGNFREAGGILVHLGPGGEPVFAGAGCHRFAMALALGKPFPAQLGAVHTSALDSLPRLRLIE